MLFVASPWLLLIVSLSLILSVWLIRVSACSPWVYFVWESLCFLDLSECLLSHIRKFLTIISSNIFSCPLFSFWTTIMQVLEKALAPHSSTLIWKIPWMEEPGRLQSMGLLRVRHDWATSLSLSFIGEGNGNPLQHSCLGNPMAWGPWWAAVFGVAESQHDLVTKHAHICICCGMWWLINLGKSCSCEYSLPTFSNSVYSYFCMFDTTFLIFLVLSFSFSQMLFLQSPFQAFKLFWVTNPVSVN